MSALKSQHKQLNDGSATNQSLQQRVSQLETQVATIMEQLIRMSDGVSNKKNG